MNLDVTAAEWQEIINSTDLAEDVAPVIQDGYCIAVSDARSVQITIVCVYSERAGK